VVIRQRRHHVEFVTVLRDFLEWLLEMGFYTYTAMYTRTNVKACLSHPKAPADDLPSRLPTKPQPSPCASCPSSAAGTCVLHPLPQAPSQLTLGSAFAALQSSTRERAASAVAQEQQEGSAADPSLQWSSSCEDWQPQSAGSLPGSWSIAAADHTPPALPAWAACMTPQLTWRMQPAEPLGSTAGPSSAVLLHLEGQQGGVPCMGERAAAG
jgi:hypothetical protein